MNFTAHITRDPDICGGEAIIAGTRVTLRTVLASLEEGKSPEELLTAFPTLTEADIQAVVAYAASLTSEACAVFLCDKDETPPS